MSFISLIFGAFLLLYALICEAKRRKFAKFLSLKTPAKRSLGALKFLRAKRGKDYLAEQICAPRQIAFVLVFTLIICALNEVFLKLNLIAVAAIAALVGHKIIRQIAAKKLREEFEENFAQMLVVLNGSLSSGANILSALEGCAASTHGALKSELGIMVRAISLGDEITSVFDASFARLPFKNYYFFLTALKVSLNQGAKLKEVLKQMQKTSIQSKALEKKKFALTSEARMSSKITAAIPFCFLFLMKFISPQNFDFILNDANGRSILYYFLGSECLGMLIIMYLMRKI